MTHRLRRPRRNLLTGRPSLYRGKDRYRVVSFTLTPQARDALERLTRDSGLSRADYLERLIRRAAGLEAE